MEHLLNSQARTATSSAIRDLLEQAKRPGMISLAGGLPDPSLFPVDELAESAERILRTQGRDHLQYGLTAGSLDLRSHVVSTTPAAQSPDHVVITTGSQQALHLLTHVLIDPGDIVVVSDPDYLGALQAFKGAQAKLHPVPVDHDGLNVDVLASAIDAGLRPTFVYVVPHFHNPTGVTLSDARFAQLLELATQHDFLVVFDDPYRDLCTGVTPVDPAPHPNAVHLRSISKVLAPGLRVGWMIGPTWLLQAVERAKQAADLHTSTLTQALALDALVSDWFPQHVATIRAATTEKRDTLCTALEKRLKTAAEFTVPGGGMFVWVRLLGDHNTSDLLTRALDHGVAFVPGSAFAVEADLRSCLRLSWATASPLDLTKGVDRLALALDC